MVLLRAGMKISLTLALVTNLLVVKFFPLPTLLAPLPVLALFVAIPTYVLLIAKVGQLIFFAFQTPRRTASQPLSFLREIALREREEKEMKEMKEGRTRAT
jgi:hypothetical protein